MPALSTSRRGPVDPADAEANMEYLHRAVDTSAAAGAPSVSVGFMRALTERQQRALWFWTSQGAVDSDDRAICRPAVDRVRHLGRHAAEVGIEGARWTVTAPAPLETGVINYRWAARHTVEQGFRGAFCTEHYGGDAIGVAIRNREYLRDVLPR